MNTPSHAIEMYLRAKDGNRPHLMAQAFASDALLHMDVRQGAMNFPPRTQGCEAIAETLVRNFGRTYENVYTFCLANAPAPGAAQFDCSWLVAMTEKETRAVRVGCGQYHWRFAPDSGLSQELTIVIDTMQTLPAADTAAVMTWADSLPWPWCQSEQMLAAAPPIPSVRSVLKMLAA